MRYLFFIMMLLIILPHTAQAVDWDKIGRPLGEDSVEMYDRYVYFDETKVADPNVSLAQPILSRQAMGFWLMEKIPQIMTLSSAGYRQELKALRPYFTDKGMRGFVQFLDQQNILSMLGQNHVDLTTVVSFTPDILADSAFNNIYRWNIDVPLTLSYRNSNASQQEVKINIDVVRVPFGKNSDGLAFDHWSIKKEDQDQPSLISRENDNDIKPSIDLNQ